MKTGWWKGTAPLVVSIIALVVSVLALFATWWVPWHAENSKRLDDFIIARNLSDYAARYVNCHLPLIRNAKEKWEDLDFQDIDTIDHTVDSIEYKQIYHSNLTESFVNIWKITRSFSDAYKHKNLSKISNVDETLNSLVDSMKIIDRFAFADGASKDDLADPTDWDLASESRSVCPTTAVDKRR